MFLFQETYYVTPGLQDVIDARVRSLHENHALSPQFVAADWMKYLGDETTYLAFRLWSSQDVTFDASQGEWMAEYNRSRPTDAFTRPPDITLFDQVRQSGRSGGATFLSCSDLLIGAQSPSMTLEHELEATLAKAPGFREYRLYRSLGAQNHFFRAEFWESRDAAVRFWRDPERREFTARVKAAAARGMPEARFYEVLHQLGDASGQG